MDDESLVEKVAREIVDRHGPDAIPIFHERAEVADMTGDQMAAETWREIADAAERILRENGMGIVQNSSPSSPGRSGSAGGGSGFTPWGASTT